MSIWARGCEDNYPCIGATFSVTTVDGTLIGSCTLEGNPENSDVIQACKVTVPLWATVIVTLDVATVPPESIPEENPISFETGDGKTIASHWGVGFNLISQPSSSQNGTTSNVAIVPIDNGQPFHSACFVLLEFSEEGCDANRDGEITFEDIPHGTYIVHQTQPLTNGRVVPNWTITVDGSVDADGWERKPVQVQTSTLAHEERPIDVSLITRDPADGGLLTNACYTLVELDMSGCDSNANGQVVLFQVPPGDYTVRQTRAPKGHAQTGDFSIKVRSLNNLPNGEIFQVPLGFVVRQAPEQNAPNTLNVSLILIDYRTGDLVKTGVCAELVGASNVGCDEDLLDGQIDFLDVPAGGPYEVRFSNTPDGIDIWTPTGLPHELWVQPELTDATVVLGFTLLNDEAAPTDAAPAIANAPSQDSATLLLTMRGCPDGLDPNTTNPATACTVPLDAPDRSTVSYPDAWTHEVMIPIPSSPRQADGTYQVAVPSNTDLQVSYLEPVVRDTFLAVGQDSLSNYGNPTIRLAPGETGHIYIYYYYTSPASVQPDTPSGQATTVFYMRGCPEGFNPDTDDFFANCTIPLDAPDASYLYHGGDGQGGMNIMWLDRQWDGGYIFNAGPYTMNISIGGLAPVLRDGYTVFGVDSGNGTEFQINLQNGETREVWVFYYYWP